MRSQGCRLVCTFEVAEGLAVGAVWDGGPTIGLHVDRDGQTVRVAGWSIWNHAWDCPLILPTPESFERFIAGRLAEPGVLDELLDLAAA